MTEHFTGSFTQQEPIPEDGIAAALDVLRNGRLHRYNVAAGELSQAALLEQEFAAWTQASRTIEGRDLPQGQVEPKPDWDPKDWQQPKSDSGQE